MTELTVLALPTSSDPVVYAVGVPIAAVGAAILYYFKRKHDW